MSQSVYTRRARNVIIIAALVILSIILSTFSRNNERIIALQQHNAFQDHEIGVLQARLCEQSP